MTLEAIQSGKPADDDILLIRRYRDGDASAFDALYEKYYGRVYSLARGILGSTEDALDAVQETFIQVARNLGSFEAKSRFSTWLYRISVNTAIQRARRNRRRSGNNSPLEEAADVVDTEVTQTLQTREQVHQVLRQLRDEDRAVLILYYWENQSLQEIGEVFGCSANAAKTRLFRARERFRDIWMNTEEVYE